MHRFIDQSFVQKTDVPSSLTRSLDKIIAVIRQTSPAGRKKSIAAG